MEKIVDSKSQRVVIIGIGYSSRIGIIRAVAQMGCEVVVVALEGGDEQPIDTYSKYVAEVIRFPQRKGSDELAHMLVEWCSVAGQKPILIPNSDFSASAIDTHYDMLSEHFLMPNIHHTQGAILQWMDKERQKALAEKLGMNVANATNIIITDGKYTIPQGIHFPCFTKTRSYIAGYKNTLHRCDNYEELLQTVAKMAQAMPNMTLMVEDFMDIETEYAVLGFSDGKNVVIPAIIEMMRMTEGKDKGVAMQGKVGPVGKLKNLTDKFADLVREIGFTGLFDIDFYMSGGKYYFDELNLRIGGSATAVTKMGVNLPGMMVMALTGKDFGSMSDSVSSTAIFANERTCIESWSDGYLSAGELRQILNSSDIRFVDDSDDTKPAKMLRRRLRIMMAKRMIKNFLPWMR